MEGKSPDHHHAEIRDKKFPLATHQSVDLGTNPSDKQVGFSVQPLYAAKNILANNTLVQHTLKRRWDSSDHPVPLTDDERTQRGLTPRMKVQKADAVGSNTNRENKVNAVENEPSRVHVRNATAVLTTPAVLTKSAVSASSSVDDPKVKRTTPPVATSKSKARVSTDKAFSSVGEGSFTRL
jgi:hypothetical protein